MWAHYGRDHTGAMFEFWSLPDEDNPLSVARAVEYKDRPPAFFSESELINDLTGIRKLDRNGLYHRYASTKSAAWAYEREWRVWYPLAQGPALYEDMPIRRSEFRGVYIGCRAEPTFSEAVIDLTSSAFPETTIFRARKREDAYAVDYAEI
jgi:hypothetical protein